MLSFLAAFDTADQSLPAPFNAESLPTYIRIYNKFKTSTSAWMAAKDMETLMEALDKRVQAVMVRDENPLLGY